MGKPKVKLAVPIKGPLHSFTREEVAALRSRLLAWYDASHRVLPWRTIAATEHDPHRRAYAVWVSEIMLQQTQVSTVVSYFERWMSRWPTVQDLAKATLEEVNQVWSGLGYYSRVRRLHEGAVKVVDKLQGKFPSDRDGLVEELPGVGQYSGSAIASIALGQVVGVVDGNVNRVLARVRAIATNISAPAPKCSSCPLRSLCVAEQRSGCVQQRSSIKSHFQQSKERAEEEPATIPDIECVAGCDFCLQKEDWDESLGVQNFPIKGQKTKQREETAAVVVVECQDGRLFLVQRPKGVYKISVASETGVCWPERYQGGQWVTREQFLSSATSTAMKKVLKAVETHQNKSKDKKSKKSSADQPSKKQKTISQFFSGVAKK
ncbi:Adenine DNA glycosylase [Portunus trituberculatus]|uniref:Adenine DNA glycosylase n=1 Tax=Portunus trituberculatus TaxID=210409 RepID=A0A5B7EAS1_PORTR|nr:Adenine DNA glycosylase [Portunus trituberculatus]